MRKRGAPVSFEVDSYGLRNSLHELEYCHERLISMLLKGLLRAENDLPQVLGSAEESALLRVVKAMHLTQANTSRLLERIDCYIDILAEVIELYLRAEEEVLQTGRPLLETIGDVRKNEGKGLWVPSLYVDENTHFVDAPMFTGVDEWTQEVVRLYEAVMAPL